MEKMETHLFQRIIMLNYYYTIDLEIKGNGCNLFYVDLENEARVSLQFSKSIK